MNLPFVVSEVQILPVKPKDGLVAFASCVIDGHFFLGNIGIHARPDGSGHRLVFPDKTLPNGKRIHCFHPLTKNAGYLLEEAITKKFQVLVEMTKGPENVTTT